METACKRQALSKTRQATRRQWRAKKTIRNAVERGRPPEPRRPPYKLVPYRLIPAGGRVDAPRTRARRCYVEEDEAEKHRGLAAVEHGEEALARMPHEIGDRHFTREDESDGARKQADD